MASPGRVFTRDELINHLYPSGEAVIDRVIDVHIGKLRQKIEEDPSNPQYIQTVRGLGYQFAESSGS
jgi:DNA-binding response OmpR family regulator